MPRPTLHTTILPAFLILVGLSSSIASRADDQPVPDQNLDYSCDYKDGTPVPGHLHIMDLPEADLHGVAFEIAGPICDAVVDPVLAGIAKMEKTKIIYLSLDSPGGISTAGDRVVEVLKKERKAGRVVKSVVANGMKCASECLEIYLQAEKRSAGPAAAFMFHGPSPWYTNVPDATRSKILVQSYIDAGVSKEWLDQISALGVFTLPDEYWMAGIELFDQHTGVVNNMIKRQVIYPVQQAPFDPQLKPR